MKKITLGAETRTQVGKGLAALRMAEVLPAVVYGQDFPSQSISVKLKDFTEAYKQAGESSLVYLELGNQSLPVIISDVSKDPVSDVFMHADFHKVSLKEKVRAEVQLVFTGESPAVKELAGILLKNLNAIEVEALPQDLPHEISVDISNLKTFADHIMVKDLILPNGVTVESSPDEVIALVQEPISQEKLDEGLAAESTTTPEEVEVIKRPGADVEVGVEPAAGETKPEVKKEEK